MEAVAVRHRDRSGGQPQHEDLLRIRDQVRGTLDDISAALAAANKAAAAGKPGGQPSETAWAPGQATKPVPEPRKTAGASLRRQPSSNQTSARGRRSASPCGTSITASRVPCSAETRTAASSPWSRAPACKPASGHRDQSGPSRTVYGTPRAGPRPAGPRTPGSSGAMDSGVQPRQTARPVATARACPLPGRTFAGVLRHLPPAPLPPREAAARSPCTTSGRTGAGTANHGSRWTEARIQARAARRGSGPIARAVQEPG